MSRIIEGRAENHDKIQSTKLNVLKLKKQFPALAEQADASLRTPMVLR